MSASDNNSGIVEPWMGPTVLAAALDPFWHFADHLRLIGEALIEVRAGRIKRLMICMPPRHGKSLIVSRYFPAWWLGNWPNDRVILAGYGDAFAATWGRQCRNTINRAVEFGLLPVGVDPTASAADRWNMDGYEGGMITAGIGGACTGYGADLLAVDDPVKSRAEAESEAFRERVWDWYSSDAYSRLHPGGAVVLTMTRWHHDDLGGRILAADEGVGDWTVLSLPALAEEDDLLGREVGEALWPERYPVAALEDIRATLGSYAWSALYQQNPTPREGGLFKRHWFELVDAIPAAAKRARHWDLAATEGGGDWTCGVLLAVHEGIYYVEDVVRGQWAPGDVEATIRQVAEMDGRDVRVSIEEEGGSAGKGQTRAYAKVLAGYRFAGLRATGSKETRAEPVASQAQVGNVKIRRAHWTRDFIEELASFPLGTHDDQVDGLSGAFERLREGSGVTGISYVRQGPGLSMDPVGPGLPPQTLQGHPAYSVERPPLTDIAGNVVDDAELRRKRREGRRMMARLGR